MTIKKIPAKENRQNVVAKNNDYISPMVTRF